MSDTGRLKQRMHHNEKVVLVAEINKLLQLSEKKAFISYIYGDEYQMIQAQRLLLNLGAHCLEFAEFVDYDQRETYYCMLTYILKRYELDLGQVGFHT